MFWKKGWRTENRNEFSFTLGNLSLSVAALAIGNNEVSLCRLFLLSTQNVMF